MNRRGTTSTGMTDRRIIYQDNNESGLMHGDESHQTPKQRTWLNKDRYLMNRDGPHQTLKQ